MICLYHRARTLYNLHWPRQIVTPVAYSKWNNPFIINALSLIEGFANQLEAQAGNRPESVGNVLCSQSATAFSLTSKPGFAIKMVADLLQKWRTWALALGVSKTSETSCHQAKQDSTAHRPTRSRPRCTCHRPFERRLAQDASRPSRRCQTRTPYP